MSTLGVVPRDLGEPAGIEREEVRDGFTLDHGADTVDVDHRADHAGVAVVGSRAQRHLEREPPADGRADEHHVVEPLGDESVEVGRREGPHRVDLGRSVGAVPARVGRREDVERRCEVPSDRGDRLRATAAVQDEGGPGSGEEVDICATYLNMFIYGC